MPLFLPAAVARLETKMETGGQFQMAENKRTLFVGLVCVDILKVLTKYPQEDIELRCLDYYRQRGGNASNSATIFSLLGGDAEFFGTLASDAELAFIQEDFKKFGVDCEHSVIITGATCPLSVVLLSLESHSRTSLHTNNNLPELTLENFTENIDLKSHSYGWVHFEGRNNAKEIMRMMTELNVFNRANCGKYVFTSLEAEKLRFAPYLDKLDMWKLPDVMFVSKDFAIGQGISNMEEAALYYFKKVKKGAAVICPWGEKGAAAISDKSGLVTSPSFPPPQILDTCGAGDTFIAASLFALGRGKSLQRSIEFGCKIAGLKCGIQGFRNITVWRKAFAQVYL